MADKQEELEYAEIKQLYEKCGIKRRFRVIEDGVWIFTGAEGLSQTGQSSRLPGIFVNKEDWKDHPKYVLETYLPSVDSELEECVGFKIVPLEKMKINSNEEKRIFGWGSSRIKLELVKSEDRLFVRDEDTKLELAQVPSEFSGRAFIDGVDRCLNVQGEELSIQKGKYYLVKNKAGNILLRADKEDTAENFIKGYNYCINKKIFALPPFWKR